MATEREIHRDDAACTCSIEDASECYYHGRVALKAKVEAVEREAATLREALAFYSDEGNYRMEVRNAPATGERYGAPGPIARDEGRRARAALAGAGRSTEGEG